MMTKEEKEWLQKAMEEYTYDEVKAMEVCFKRLVALETSIKSSDYEKTALELLNQLHDYTFSLDNAKNLCVFGGIGWLVDQILKNPYSKVRQKCALILAECSQNQIYIQREILRYHPLRMMNTVINEELDCNKEACLAA